MARVTVEGGEFVVRLSWRERLAARRGDVRVPLSAVRGAEVEPSWWRVLRGVPGPGSWRPGRCLGVRHVQGGEDFVAVRARGPVLCVELEGAGPLRRVAVSVSDAERMRGELSPPPPREEDGDREEPPPHRPLLQHEGGTADDHGRAPGTPSRTGTGAQPPADAERVRRARAGVPDGGGDAGGGGAAGAIGGVRPPSQP